MEEINSAANLMVNGDGGWVGLDMPLAGTPLGGAGQRDRSDAISSR
ncbi:hypothetical protein [Micromonospora sp. L32]